MKTVQLTRLEQLKNGALEGGFQMITNNLLAVFGGETTNNCNSGNCVAGCGTGQNVVAGCGSTNGVPGCGA